MNLTASTFAKLICFSLQFTEFSPDRCATPNINADVILQTFGRTCYEFHVTRGESYDKAQEICQSHGTFLLLFCAVVLFIWGFMCVFIFFCGVWKCNYRIEKCDKEIKLFGTLHTHDDLLYSVFTCSVNIE